MNITRLYFFDDAPGKQGAFQEICRLLQLAGARQGKRIENGIMGSYAEIEKSSDALEAVAIQALEDSHGLLLLDLFMDDPNYPLAGNNILATFSKKFPELRESVKRLYRELPVTNNADDLLFAAVLFCLGERLGRRVLIASSGTAQMHRLRLFKADQFLRFPDRVGDTAHIRDSVLRLAKEVGITAKQEADEPIREEQAIMLNLALRSIVSALPEMMTGNDDAERGLRELRKCWNELQDCAPIDSSLIADRVFGSHAGDSIAMILRDSGTLPAVALKAELLPYCKTIVTKLARLPGDFCWAHGLWEQREHNPEAFRELVFIGDYSARLFLEALALSSRLRGYRAEVLWMNDARAFPSPDKRTILVWTSHCQNVATRDLLRFLCVDFEKGISREVDLLPVSHAQKSPIIEYLEQCGARNLLKTCNVALLPAKPRITPIEVQEKSALHSMLEGSIVHGNIDRKLLHESLAHLCPWLSNPPALS